MTSLGYFRSVVFFHIHALLDGLCLRLPARGWKVRGAEWREVRERERREGERGRKRRGREGGEVTLPHSSLLTPPRRGRGGEDTPTSLITPSLLTPPSSLLTPHPSSLVTPHSSDGRGGERTGREERGDYHPFTTLFSLLTPSLIPPGGREGE